MKKTKRLLVSTLITLLVAVLFSLCMTCLLELVGIALGAAIDSHILREYPRFLPFCVAVGFVAVVLLGITVWLTAKRKDRLGWTKRTLATVLVSAALLSVPLAAGWSALFDFLQTR